VSLLWETQTWITAQLKGLVSLEDEVSEFLGEDGVFVAVQVVLASIEQDRPRV
jgi:hypothetical protein